MTNPAHGVLNVQRNSVRLLLTKNPACSFNCPWGQVHGISFQRFPWLWQTVGPISGPSRDADSSLAFWGPSSGVTPSPVRLHSQVWWTDASRKQTSTVRPRRKPPCPAWSGISPWTCRYELLYRIAPRIIGTHKLYHDDNVGTQSVGKCRPVGERLFTSGVCWIVTGTSCVCKVS